MPFEVASAVPAVVIVALSSWDKLVPEVLNPVLDDCQGLGGLVVLMVAAILPRKISSRLFRLSNIVSLAVSHRFVTYWQF